MNLLLLEPGELGGGGRVLLSGRRAEHLLRVLKVETGRSLRLGVIDGGTGRGEVTALPGDGTVELRVEVTGPATPRAGIDLIVALPRPQALHRILQSVAAMRVDRLALVNAWRVEKSFFHSPSLRSEKIRRHLVLGAEQGVTTRLPEVRIEPLLVPFVRERPRRSSAGRRYILHPEAKVPFEETGVSTPGPVEIAIGPEGGWIDREIATFGEVGFEPVLLGPWILRVETAVVAALAQLELVRR